MDVTIGSTTIELVQGDITEQRDIRAVVNAANAALMPGGGVAGAIHRAAGPQLAEACGPLAPIGPGEAVVTEAFDLPNDFVVHCLGPVYRSDEPAAELLASCYTEALRLAEAREIESIAFPAISTGAFGYPMSDAADIAVRTAARTAPTLEHVRRVRFVLLGDAAYEMHLAALREAVAPERGG